jgi:serine/threonine protein kinase
VVHRDVKPANIMFDHDGRVMLTDFGISKALQAASGFTGTGMIIGTPHYMAPEQAKGGTVDGRADEYSLGVVGYRMITGELPYTGDSVHTILYKHIFEEVPSAGAKRGDAPQFLTAAISRSLSKEPDQRFATMEEFATAVWPEQPVAVPKAGAATKSQRRPPPRPSRTASADAPTEVTNAPTTPIPRAEMKIPAKKKQRSSVGMVIGALVVVAVGVGGYFALAKKPPAAASVDTVRVATQTPPLPPPPPPPPAQRRATPPPAPPPAAAVARGYITVNSEPPGTVFIDGREIGPVPVIEEAVPVGRHTIRVERPGFKTKTETVDVPATNPVRRRYVLDPEG